MHWCKTFNIVTVLHKPLLPLTIYPVTDGVTCKFRYVKIQQCMWSTLLNNH